MCAHIYLLCDDAGSVCAHDVCVLCPKCVLCAACCACSLIAVSGVFEEQVPHHVEIFLTSAFFRRLTQMEGSDKGTILPLLSSTQLHDP